MTYIRTVKTDAELVRENEERAVKVHEMLLALGIDPEAADETAYDMMSMSVEELREEEEAEVLIQASAKLPKEDVGAAQEKLQEDLLLELNECY